MIEQGPREEREGLRDYAVSLIRHQARGRDEENGEIHDPQGDDEPAPVPESSSNAATLIAYGVLLLPAGGLLALVLPPIGLMLGVTAFAMMAAGIGLSVVTRLRGL